ncbi:Tail fiber protein [Ceratobasidium sp. AG-Ba]|nr:Tail fiber protein [Ceratobasidium sp. AG-Ba]
MHDDPDAAQDLLTFDGGDLNLIGEAKGKQPSVSYSSAQHGSKPGPQVQTGYTGISVDSNDYTIRAKHAPKGPNATPLSCQDGTGACSSLGPNKAGLQLATQGQTASPLRRTDSTTVLDDKPLVYPVSYTSSGQSLKPPKPPQADMSAGLAQPEPIQLPRAILAPQALGSATPNAPPADNPPPSKKPRPNVTASTPTVAGTSAQHAARAPSGLGSVQRNQPLQAQHIVHYGQSQGNRKPATAVQQQPNKGSIAPPVQHDPLDEEVPASDGEFEPTVAAAAQPKTHTGKATFKSFPEEQQPIIERMAKLSRAYVLANGPYDDSPVELATHYKNWPEDWTKRKSRAHIVSQCLMKACREYDMALPFIPRHMKCVTELIRTHHTGAADRVKPFVDHAFGFTLEKSDRNERLSKALLPFNFHYQDILNKRGPFEHAIVGKACRAVCFHKSSAIGVKHNGIFDATPIGFLAYTSAMIHSVIWAYRTGEFSNENLDSDIQTAVFRRVLCYLITMHTKKANKLETICYQIFDQCMVGLEPQSTVRDLSPEPEREWTPDITEDYVRQYQGDTQQDSDCENDGREMDSRRSD